MSKRAIGLAVKVRPLGFLLAAIASVSLAPAALAQSGKLNPMVEAAQQEGARLIETIGGRLIDRVASNLVGCAEASRSTNVIIHNNSPYVFYKVNDSFTSGGFSSNLSLQKLEAYSVSGYRVESNGFMTGVTGADIRFGLSPGRSNNFEFRIVTSNPYAGDNTATVETSSRLKYDYTIGGGDCQDVTVYIYDAAPPATEPANGKVVALLGHHGQYASAQADGSMDADRPENNEWEKFEVVLHDDGMVSFRTNHDTYVVAEANGTLNANRSEIGDWEKFELIQHADGTVSFRSAHGLYLVAEADGEMNANRQHIGDWEKFRMIE